MTDPSRTSPAANDQASADSQGPLDPTHPRAEGAEGEPNFAAPARAGEVGQLGRYRVLQKLGAGGMGAVYLGYDAALERKVALKVMLPQHATNRDAKERFLREAKAAAKVKSDHVVIIHDVGEERGIPFIAMEYLLGSPLDQFLKTKGDLHLTQALRVVRETALGLSAAHALGLIHRDIKPGNIWLEAPKGRVKILDFGLARPAEDDAHLTGSGAVLGTPAYMSPEQGRGLKVDHRTDLFSLGVVLYRLTTGRMPFTGTSAMAVLTSLGMDTPVAPRQHNPELPEAVEAVIHKLLAKNPAERFQSAKEVIDALTEIENPRSGSGQLPVVVATPVPPLAVSAQTQNVWEGIDASESVPVPLAESAEVEGGPVAERAAAHVTKPARKGSKGPLVLASAALLTACAVLAVVLWWPKKQPEPVAHNPGGDNPTPGGKPQPPVTVTDSDRTAAEYVLSVGGWVGVNGEEKDIKAAVDLPKGRFSLTYVSLYGNTKVTDSGLANFKDCQSLTALYLTQTPVSDAGLAHFKDHKNLTLLSLTATQTTDTGLAYFKGCRKLTRLGLERTQVSDVGLAHFKDCKELTALHIRETKVTAKAIAEFSQALPGCKIIYDGGVIEPTVILDPDRKAAEWVLSVGGTVRVNGAEKDIKTKDELPNGNFSLTGVNLRSTNVTNEQLIIFKDCKNLTWLELALNQKVSDAGLAHFKDCKTLTFLNLHGLGQVSDAGLANFKDCKDLAYLFLSDRGTRDAELALFKNCPNLMLLDLANANVGKEGLAHFKDCKNLTSLNLRGTRVTDDALIHLKDWKLTSLNLQRTKVTATWVEDFAKLHPQCKIVTPDGGTIEPKN